jgi:hypothetical protein
MKARVIKELNKYIEIDKVGDESSMNKILWAIK